jgi:hypothetical protein
LLRRSGITLRKTRNCFPGGERLQTRKVEFQHPPKIDNILWALDKSIRMFDAHFQVVLRTVME